MERKVNMSDQNRDEDLEVMAMMKKYGGGFVSALAEAAYRADGENLRRIKAAWPEYWAQYKETLYAELQAQRRADSQREEHL